VLSQLNFYINAHAEELRDYFVSHKGKKELEIRDVGTIGSYDFGVFARRMTALIQENVKDPDFRDWVRSTADYMSVRQELILFLHFVDHANIQHNDSHRSHHSSGAHDGCCKELL